ncbi:MAG: DUF4340 domain-containing protein [Polyangiaceae bacterium]|nr:DUF4340 domain-containing protein [Polyangiaceae bacterium]
MALTTEHKLYIALGVAAALGGAVYWQNEQAKKESASYTAEGRARDLPKLEFTEEKTKTVDSITITQPAGDAGKPPEIVLEKKGEDWHLVKPVGALANQTNVKSLLDNLETLKVVEEIATGAEQYEKFGVSEAKATHARFSHGGEVIADLYFGDGGGRGQMTRIAGRDGVYAVKGYSSYLYARDLKDWRDRTIFKFEDEKAKSVEIQNEHGVFSFERSGTTWSAKLKEPKALAAKALERFDEAKLKDLLRAYKALTADAFAEAKQPGDVGLATPKATVTIRMEDGATHVLSLGDTAEGSSKWAKRSGSDEIFSVASWTADWATAEASKFQKPDEKKDEKKGEKKDEKAPAAPPPAEPE